MKHLRLHLTSGRTFCGVLADDFSALEPATTECWGCLAKAVVFGEKLALDSENKLRALANQKEKS